MSHWIVFLCLVFLIVSFTRPLNALADTLGNPPGNSLGNPFGDPAAVGKGAKLADVRPVDELYLQLFIQDGQIQYKDDGKGNGAFMAHESQGGEKRLDYGTLDLALGASPSSFTLTSTNDPAYATPQPVVSVHRKTKCNGNVAKWPEPDTWSVEHTLYLKLPSKLKPDCSYTLTLDPKLGASKNQIEFVFDIFNTVSEAVHVNTIGYVPQFTQVKAADLYQWLGDGGARDYAAFVGKTVWLYDVNTKQKFEAGKVAFHKKAAKETHWNLTASDVWTCDVSAFNQSGTYRLVVDGVGCSQDFVIDRTAYLQPFRITLLGFYYMRIGEPADMIPVPRQPRLIPGVDPKNFTVYLTHLNPWHDDWKTLPGDVWDVQDWSKWKLPGEPTNPNAFGGHSDACDWDRHIGHVSIIYDMLLPYMLSNGQLSDDATGIRESGNGIPDLIDEAQNEVDFWLRLRDPQGGYSCGLNNPNKDHSVMYQAGAKPFAAWANAANAAMLADCFRIAGKPELAEKYRDAAVEAWAVANNQDLDVTYTIGNGVARGRDYRLLAAACLYNLTGDKKYEAVVAADSLAAQPDVPLDVSDKHSQYWPTAVYLLTAKHNWQAISHPKLVEQMKARLLADATAKNVEPSKQRPSRRAYDGAHGWFQTIADVNAAVLAHALSDDQNSKDALLSALLLEADWTLGRNPMNMVQTTGLGKRFPTDIYTSGKNDGSPGVHPGHTPYMNSRAWGKGFMADPQWYAKRGYPDWENWPHAEALWQARYCYSNNEFTPQQSMRPKIVLYAYLHYLAGQ
jgi:endoglucanase